MSTAKKTVLPRLRWTSSRRRLVSDSIASGLAFALVLTVGQRLIGFARGVLFCRLMSDQQLGQWSMVWSYLMLLAPLAALGLPGCFGKYTEYYRQRGQLSSLVVRTAFVCGVTVLGLALGLILFPRAAAWLLFRDAAQAPLMIWIALAVVAVAVSNFLGALMESLRQVRVVTWMRMLNGLVFAVAGVGLLCLMSSGTLAATWAFTAACLIGSLPAIWVIWTCRDEFATNGSAVAASAMWARIVPFAIWLWAANLLNNLFEVSDRYLLIHWSPLPADLAQAAVGQYHSGRVVPLLLVSVAAMLGGLLMPYLSAAWEARQEHRVRQQLNWTVKLVSLAFTAAGLMVLWTAPLLFGTVFEGRYDQGLAVLPWTLVYCIWFSLHTVGQDYLWVAEKGKWAALATGSGLVVNIVLNLVWIPQWGLDGAVWATAAGNGWIVLAIFVLNHLFGCRTDRGIWLVAAVPLLLLASPAVATAGWLAVAVLAWYSPWLLTGEEKRDLQFACVQVWQRCQSARSR